MSSAGKQECVPVRHSNKRGRPRQIVPKSGDIRFTCSICNHELINLDALIRHKRKHEPPGGFLCTVCKAPFTSVEERNAHKAHIHRSFYCTHCEEAFTEEQQHTDHIRLLHGELQSNNTKHEVCETCGLQFRTRVQLRNHMESKCGTEKRFLCDICNRYYSTAASLSVHRGLHEAKKDHLCNYCGASFYNRGQLKVHERIHTGEKPYKCDKCDKAFAHRESLVTHSTIHSGIKPYICVKCNDRFSCVGNLNKHRKRRPLTCGRPENCSLQRFTERPSTKTLMGPAKQKHPPKGPKCSLVVHQNGKEPLTPIPMAEGSDYQTNPQQPHDVQLAVDTGEQHATEVMEPVEEGEVLAESGGEMVKILDVQFSVQTMCPLGGAENLRTEEHFETFDEIEDEDHVEDFEKEEEYLVEENEEDRAEELSKMGGLRVSKTTENDGVEVEVSMRDDTIEEPTILATQCGSYDNCHQNLAKMSELSNSASEDSYLCVILKNDCESTGDDSQHQQQHWYTIITSNQETRVVARVDLRGKDIPSIRKETTPQNSKQPNVFKTVKELEELPPTAEIIVTATNNPTGSDRDLDWKEFLNDSNRSSFSSEEHSKDGEWHNVDSVDKPTSNQKSQKGAGKEKSSSTPHEGVATAKVTSLNGKRKSRSTRKRACPEISRAALDEMKIKLEEEKLEQQLKTLRESYEIVDESYRCSRCPLQYTTEYLIARHLERVHGCQLAETLEMLQYMKRTAQEKLYRCKYCDRTYISLTRLKNHLTHHGPNGTLRHKCPCCGTYFETAQEARAHALAMHRERLECGSCGKQFQDPESLQSHIRYAHRGAKEARRFRFVCHRCGKNFPSRTVLTDHERSNCGETPLYRCDTCGKHYSSFCSLKAHQTVHEDRLAFVCGYCQKRYRTKGQLKVHERSHTGEKPFKCEHCPKSFPYRESLVTHRSTHTGIKPHACDVCGQKFTCIANLQSHRRARRTTCGKDMKKRKLTKDKMPPESKGC